MADVDVVVVGGGLAGLIAARDVAATGRRVTVLEARDRLGGRTWTTTLPGTDVEVELGGTWVHPDAQPAVAAEIARYGLPMRSYPEPAYNVFVTRGRRLVGHDGDSPWTSAMRLLDGDLARIATRLGGPDERAARAGAADLDVSVESWLDGVSPPEPGRDAMLAFAAAMGGGRPSELGILPLVLDAIDNGYDLDAGWADIGVSFIGGTRRLVEAISAGLDIRLSSVVARVEQGRRRRHGAARGRRGGRGARPPWSRCRSTSGATSSSIRRSPAARRRPARPAIRADRRRSSPSPATCPTGSPAAAGEPRSTRSCRWATSRAGGSSRASRRCSCSTLPTVAAVTDAVRAFIPDAEVVAHGGHDWNADRFSRGVWFAEPPGWQRTIGGEDLEAPFGRLAFAGGDIPRTGAGWIEGAVASGGRAALRIRELLA